LVSKYMDIYSGLFLLVVSVLMFVATFSFEALTTTRVGPDFMPKIIAGLIAVFSILIVVSGFNKLKAIKNVDASTDVVIDKNAENFDMEEEKASYTPVLMTLGIMVGYILLMPYIGFLIMTALYLFVQMMILSHKTNRKNGLFIIISVISSVTIYYVFKSIFYVMLPTGILG
jgi:putative tricarboxylic transport membrane protein